LETKRKSRGEKRMIHGFLFLLAIWLSTYFGSFLTIMPVLMLYLVDYNLFRRGMDNVAAFWFLYPTALNELVLGTKIVCTGDNVRSNERTLILLNHRTYFDWLFLWSWILRFGSLQHEKIILKSVLKLLPGAGWAMQCFQFLFIHRRWESDQPHMTKLLTNFVKQDYPLQLLIFPEGTDMNNKGIEKSNEFATKNNLPLYKQVLHPRTTGFKHAISLLRGHIDAVYDITVGYPRGIPDKRTSLLKGKFPHEIHFNLRRYPIQDIPENEEELSEWLLKIWAEKEKTLEQFYKDGHFDEPRVVCARDKDIQFCQIKLWASLIFWTTLIALSFYWLFTCSTLYLIIFGFGHVLFLGLSFGAKGFDTLEVNMLYDKFAKLEAEKKKKD